MPENFEVQGLQSETQSPCPHTYRVEPHDSYDPDGEGQVDDQDNQQDEDKQVKAAFPPAIDADLVQVVRGGVRNILIPGGGDVLLPHHLQSGSRGWISIYWRVGSTQL